MGGNNGEKGLLSLYVSKGKSELLALTLYRYAGNVAETYLQTRMWVLLDVR